jgi:hypothetical protein
VETRLFYSGADSVSATSPFKSNLVSFIHRRRTERAVIEQRERTLQDSALQPFEEQHFPISYWARRWGFSVKTVREWFRDEYCAGIVRQPNTGRRSKRDYTTITVSASAAARVYGKRTTRELIH